jgi:hypothetical protein
VGCLALTAATFGVVVVGRGVLWGSKFYLPTRYQYVPLLGVVVCLCLALGAVDVRRAVPSRLKSAAFSLWLVAALGVHLALSPGINHHQQARRATNLTVNEMAAHPRCRRRRVTFRTACSTAWAMLIRPSMFPGWAAAF